MEASSLIKPHRNAPNSPLTRTTLVIIGEKQAENLGLDGEYHWEGAECLEAYASCMHKVFGIEPKKQSA